MVVEEASSIYYKTSGGLRIMSMIHLYIGIDPGKKGAIACIDDDNTVHWLRDIDGLYEYLIRSHCFDEYYWYTGCVEDVCGRPGQSCQANTTFMKLAGKAELTASCICEEVVLVKPQVWKKYFNLITSKDLTKTEKKHLSIEKAKKLFPSVADMLTASKDGRAEALLIALYGKDLWQTKQSTLNKV